MKVIPPNFGYVEDGIFRSGAPAPRHYGFLASLGLRTCVLLTDTHDIAFVHWLQETGVTIFTPLSNEGQGRSAYRGGGASSYHLFNTPVPTGAATGSSGGAVAGRSGARPGPKGTRSVESKDDVASLSAGVMDSTQEGGSDNAAASPGDGADGFDKMSSVSARASPSNFGSSNTPAAITTTSHAVRFLQENATEQQMNSSKFSPLLVQEPLSFPGGSSVSSAGGGLGGGTGANGGRTVVVPFPLAAAPSYEGRLHGLMTLSEAVVVSILHIVLDPHYYPLLITCAKGRYRSGIVCGCLRKLQGWTLVAILEEYRRFAGNKSRADNEEFIELFDEELVNLELPDGRRPTILYHM